MEQILKFRQPNLQDRVRISEYYRASGIRSVKNSFASNYVWRKINHIEFAEEEGILYTKTGFGKCNLSFQLPIFKSVPNYEKAVGNLIKYCETEGVPLRLFGIFGSETEKLKEIYGDRMVISYLRDESDYIYLRENLATLAGKKYHGKRNHVARFMQTDWRYEPMTEQNIGDAIMMHKEWAKTNDVCRENLVNDGVAMDGCASLQAFEHFQTLHLVGGILYQENRAVAYTIGAPLTEDTFAVHFEKAFSEVEGAYPMINQQFILRETEGFTYIDREEDTGDEGLRRAKLSYHPEFLTEEYGAELKSLD